MSGGGSPYDRQVNVVERPSGAVVFLILYIVGGTETSICVQRYHLGRIDRHSFNTWTRKWATTDALSPYSDTYRASSHSSMSILHDLVIIPVREKDEFQHAIIWEVIV